MSDTAPHSDPPPARPYVDPIPPTVRLTRDNATTVAGFTCARAGAVESRFEADVSRWIADPGPAGALSQVETGQVEVWLYFADDGRRIGYCSLGEQALAVGDTGRVVMVDVLPYFAVHGQFRGQQVPREQRYGRRILGGFIEEVERRGRHERLLLYVDPENQPARSLYEEFGFVWLDRWADPDDGGREWDRMVRRVRPAG